MLGFEHNYWYFIKAINPQKCQEIIECASEKIHKAGTTDDSNDQDYRKSTVAWISDSKIYDLLNPFIHAANNNSEWNFQWDWNEPCQFTIYNKGDYYQWHNDIIPRIASSNKNLSNKIRKLSLTLHLTNPSEYEGGDFQFRWLSKKGRLKTTTVKNLKDIGTIIVFPSFMLHRVTPVTRGIRQSLVNWSLGKDFE